MWIFTQHGFLSVVKSNEEPDTLVARARNKEHLQNLLPEARILSLRGTDYKYRAFITPARFAELMAQLATSIDYDNFKKSIPDPDFKDACSDVWAAMFKYQQRCKSP